MLEKKHKTQSLFKGSKDVYLQAMKERKNWMYSVFNQPVSGWVVSMSYDVRYLRLFIDLFLHPLNSQFPTTWRYGSCSGKWGVTCIWFAAAVNKWVLFMAPIVCLCVCAFMCAERHSRNGRRAHQWNGQVSVWSQTCQRGPVCRFVHTYSFSNRIKGHWLIEIELVKACVTFL